MTIAAGSDAALTAVVWIFALLGFMLAALFVTAFWLSRWHRKQRQLMRADTATPGKVEVESLTINDLSSDALLRSTVMRDRAMLIERLNLGSPEPESSTGSPEPESGEPLS